MILSDHGGINAARWTFFSACLLLAAIYAVSPGYAASTDRRLTGPVQAIVERVIDGDTLVVRARIWLDQEVRTKVRIAHIDTPELSARCSRERQMAMLARDFIQNILFAKGPGEATIWLSDIDQDKYGGRVLARVAVNSGDDIAGALVQAGLAQNYDGKKRTDWCRDPKL